MTPNKYQKDALRTNLASYDLPRIRSIAEKMPQLLHAQMGITTELGEITDTLKKHIVSSINVAIWRLMFH